MKRNLFKIGLVFNCLFLTSIAFSQVGLLKQETREPSISIDLSIEKIDENNYNFVSKISLGKDSYLYSPFSNDEFYLPLTFNLIDNEHFILQDQLVELPASKPEIDPYINKPINYIRNNTSYSQKIKIITSSDFSYKGLIEYLLEPSCIPYDLEYEIRSVNGEVLIEKIGVSVSKEYKRQKHD